MLRTFMRIKKFKNRLCRNRAFNGHLLVVVFYLVEFYVYVLYLFLWYLKKKLILELNQYYLPVLYDFLFVLNEIETSLKKFIYCTY